MDRMAELLDFALDTAHRAGDLLCEFYGRKLATGHKSSEIDLVTEADLASEQLIVGAIRGAVPGHAILAEEGTSAELTLRGDATEAPHLWIVDPLDGTVNYAHGYPVWGVTLALAEEGCVVLGVIHAPLRSETFWAVRGRGAWCAHSDARMHTGAPDRNSLRVSDVERLRDALVATGFAYKRATLADNNLAEFQAVMPRVQGVRRAGAAILDLADVAAGRLDAYWEMHLKPWDWAAGTLLVEEAGGLVTDMRGEPWTLRSCTIAVSNGLLHSQLLALLGQGRSCLDG